MSSGAGGLMKGRKSERGMQGLVHSTKGPNEPPSGVYDVFNPGDRVRFYMPAASRGSDGMATGTIVNKIDKPNKTSQALVGQPSSHFPEYQIEVDSEVAGRTVELTGACLHRIYS